MFLSIFGFLYVCLWCKAVVGMGNYHCQSCFIDSLLLKNDDSNTVTVKTQAECCHRSFLSFQKQNPPQHFSARRAHMTSYNLKYDVSMLRVSITVPTLDDETRCESANRNYPNWAENNGSSLKLQPGTFILYWFWQTLWTTNHTRAPLSNRSGSDCVLTQTFPGWPWSRPNMAEVSSSMRSELKDFLVNLHDFVWFCTEFGQKQASRLSAR